MQNSMEVFNFFFRQETPFLAKFGPKNQNCQFKLKFGTCTNFEYAEFKLFVNKISTNKHRFFDKINDLDIKFRYQNKKD